MGRGCELEKHFPGSCHDVESLGWVAKTAGYHWAGPDVSETYFLFGIYNGTMLDNLLP